MSYDALSGGPRVVAVPCDKISKLAKTGDGSAIAMSEQRAQPAGRRRCVLALPAALLDRQPRLLGTAEEP